MVANICGWCGEEFDAKGAAKFCSTSCREAGAAERNRRYNEVNEDAIRERKRAWRAANPEYNRAYREANKAVLSEYHRAYYAANKDTIAERDRGYREAHKDAIRGRKRAYYEANKAAAAEKGRVYREANKDALAEKSCAYRKTNHATLKEKQSAYREANRVVIREKKRTQYAANRDATSEKQRVRRKIRKAKAGCSVYVIYAECFSAFKVGVGTFPKDRLSQAQVHFPERLAMTHVFKFADKDVAMTVEQRAHEKLAGHHLRGEWFKTDLPTVLAAIETAIAETGATLADSIDEDVQRAHERKLQDAAKVYDRIAA